MPAGRGAGGSGVAEGDAIKVACSCEFFVVSYVEGGFVRAGVGREGSVVGAGEW